jgi:uncharacterized protein (TIGR00661 family)
MGHAMRSRVVLTHLVNEGHDVTIMASSRAVDYLDRFFGGVKRIHGMHIITEENRVRLGKTIWSNALRGAAALPTQIKAYFDLLEDSQPEVVITDFESWTHLYGESHRIPVFSVDNMHVIHRCHHAPELLEGERASFEVTKAFIKGKIPFAEHYFITTFFYPPLRRERTSLYPPILRPEILAIKPTRGDHAVVYQTSGAHQALTDALRQTGIECRVYGLRRDLKEDLLEDNLLFRPFDDKQFVEDLASAKAVVATAGFTLMGECVSLGKPLLAVPVGRQFEQILNARYLTVAGYGHHVDELSGEALRTFLDDLPRCEDRLATYRREGNGRLFQALDEHLDRAAAGLY